MENSRWDASDFNAAGRRLSNLLESFGDQRRQLQNQVEKTFVRRQALANDAMKSIENNSYIRPEPENAFIPSQYPSQNHQLPHPCSPRYFPFA